MNNVTNKSAQDTQAQRNIADLQKRMAFLENLLDYSNHVSNVGFLYFVLKPVRI